MRSAMPVGRARPVRRASCSSSPASPCASSERAQQELRASGGRRPRLVTTGRDALTASELRVAELAVSGATNTQIAQSLYVSVKTVETHLSNAYVKLGLAGSGSRGRLAEML